jgi:hypothetical protein
VSSAEGVNVEECQRLIAFKELEAWDFPLRPAHETTVKKSARLRAKRPTLDDSTEDASRHDCPVVNERLDCDILPSWKLAGFGYWVFVSRLF